MAFETPNCHLKRILIITMMVWCGTNGAQRAAQLNEYRQYLRCLSAI